MRPRLYLATVSQDAAKTAKAFHIGLELDQYCMAENMEGKAFSSTDAAVKSIHAEAGSPPLIFHAPFNELHPAAIDKEIREIAFKRYNRAFEIARGYGINKMVVHSGYLPHVYFKEWHHEKSVEFWRTYMKDKPDDFILCIENVLEDEPYMMHRIVEEIGLPNVQLCLDVGHANIMSQAPIKEWLNVMNPYLGHIHIHNNKGERDIHDPVQSGDIDMREVLDHVRDQCDGAVTLTIESLDGRASLDWMNREGYIK